MASDKGPELLREGEGDQEVVTRKLALNLFFKPVMCLVLLAAGAVSVAA